METVTRMQSVLLFVLYQLTLLVGLAFLPVALVTHRFGITLPFGRALRRMEAVLDGSTGR